MSDLTCQCTTSPPASLSKKLEALRSATASVASRVTVLENTVANLPSGSVTEHGRVVYNEEQLNAALAIGMPAWVSGEIVLEGFLEGGRQIGVRPEVEDAQIHGLSNGIEQGRLSMVHNPLLPCTIIKNRAKRFKASNIEVTSGHPLTSDTGVADIGLDMDASDDSLGAGYDISGSVIEDCHFHHLFSCITRGGSGGGNMTSRMAEGLTILRNNLHSYYYAGMDLPQNLARTCIANNRIVAIDAGDTHQNMWNAIWLGNYADDAIVAFNYIKNYGRHGIEYWNSQGPPGNTNGNWGGKILFNNIEDGLNHTGLGSFGISAFGAGNSSTHIIGNSSVRTGYGIETYNDPVNISRIFCSLNYIHTAYTAISINAVSNGEYSDNIVEECTNWGLKIENGGTNITIKDNTFRDAGMEQMLVNGNRLTITNISRAADGVITVAETIGQNILGVWYGINRPWEVGKPLFITDVVGMWQINRRTAVLTITGPNTFTCGINTSAMDPYITSGSAQVRMRNISICNNDFNTTRLITAAVNPTATRSAIRFYDFQDIVCKDNTSNVLAGLAAGGFQAGRGRVWCDHAGVAASESLGFEIGFAGSNLRLDY